MRLFPGRTLDELDDIDLPRHMRALEAERLVQDVRVIRQWESDGGEIDIDYDVLMELEAWRQRKND